MKTKCSRNFFKNLWKFLSIRGTLYSKVFGLKVRNISPTTISCVLDSVIRNLVRLVTFFIITKSDYKLRLIPPTDCQHEDTE